MQAACKLEIVPATCVVSVCSRIDLLISSDLGNFYLPPNNLIYSITYKEFYSTRIVQMIRNTIYGQRSREVFFNIFSLIFLTLYTSIPLKYVTYHLTK